jgi:adenylate cyclase
VSDELEPRQARDEAARGRLKRLREAALKFDSHPAVHGAVEQLRRRAPGSVRSGDETLISKGISALEPDRPSALHELGLGALQVWRSVADSAGRGQGEQEVTIVFTDLVGFSSWALQVGDESALELLRAVGDAVEESFAAYGGTVVKRLGDGVMAVFDEPQDAVDASHEAQAALERIEVAGHRPRLRVGVHHGKPQRVRGDYLGVDVNVAARVAEQAKGGEVLVSAPTLELVDTGALTSGRAKRLKAEGAPRDLRVSAVSR